MSDCNKVILRQKILDILPYLGEFSVEHNYVDFEISGTDCTSIYIDTDLWPMLKKIAEQCLEDTGMA